MKHVTQIRTRALLILSSLATVAVLAFAPPAFADSGSVSVSLSCGQAINATFSVSTGHAPFSAEMIVIEDGATVYDTPFTFTGGSTDYPGFTADAGHTWEVVTNWSAESGGSSDNAITCPAPPPPQTIVTVNPPPTTTTPAQTTTTPPDNGGGGTTTTVETVTPATPPTVDFEAQVATGVGAVAFTSSVSTGTNQVVSTVWNFGDGASGLGSTVTHRYAGPGDYVVSLTVVDAGGLTAVAARDLTVAETPGDATLDSVILGPRLTQFATPKLAAKPKAAKKAAKKKKAPVKAKAKTKAKAKAKRA